jgi:glutathione synthase/RimK-type ligase-like ATP-grasp enzyme
MKLFILPYKMESTSAKALATELGVLRIRAERSKWKWTPDKMVLNWGCSTRPKHIPEDCRVLNDFEAVAIASNKLRTFEVFEDEEYVNYPSFTTDRATAQLWADNGGCVVVRHTLVGYGGKGIELVEPHGKVPEAPLYTAYIKKKQEYRVHVFNGRIIDITRKALNPEMNIKNVDWRIRNHEKGFIFVRTDKDGADVNDTCPFQVQNQALLAVKALGLDFGAVDVIYNQRANMAYVLEVNTAPGIMGTALEAYARAIRNYMQ